MGELLLSRLVDRVRHDQRQHREATSKPAGSYLPEHSHMRGVPADKSVKVTASAQSRGKITRTSLFPVLEKIYRKDFSTLNCIAVNKQCGKRFPVQCLGTTFKVASLGDAGGNAFYTFHSKL